MLLQAGEILAHLVNPLRQRRVGALVGRDPPLGPGGDVLRDERVHDLGGKRRVPGHERHFDHQAAVVLENRQRTQRGAEHGLTRRPFRLRPGLLRHQGLYLVLDLLHQGGRLQGRVELRHVL